MDNKSFYERGRDHYWNGGHYTDRPSGWTQEAAQDWEEGFNDAAACAEDPRNQDDLS